jgi:MFS family permease
VPFHVRHASVRGPAGDRPQHAAAESSPARRRTWVGLLTVFALVTAGTTLPSPLFGLYQRQLGLSSLDLTVLYAIYTGGVIGALALLAGPGRSMSTRARLGYALLLSAAADVVFLLTTQFSVLIIARVLSGLGAGLVTGAATAAIITLGGQHRRERFAAIAVAVNMGGFAFGTVLCGVVAESGLAILQMPYLAHLVLVVLAAPALRWLPRDAEHGAGQRPADRHRPQASPGGIPRALFLPAVIIGGIGFGANGLVTSQAAVLLSTDIHITNYAVIGVVTALVFAATGIGQVLARRVADDRRAMSAGAGGLLAGLAILAVTVWWPTLPGLAGAAIVLGVSTGMLIQSGFGALAAATPARLSTRLSTSYFTGLYLLLAVAVIGTGALQMAMESQTAQTLACAVLAAALLAGFTLHPLQRSRIAGSGSQTGQGSLREATGVRVSQGDVARHQPEQQRTEQDINGVLDIDGRVAGPALDRPRPHLTENVPSCSQEQIPEVPCALRVCHGRC